MAPAQAEQKRAGSYGTLVLGEVKAEKDKRLVGPFLIWLKFEHVQGLWRPGPRFFAGGLMRRRIAAVSPQFGAATAGYCLPTMPGWKYMARPYRARAEVPNGTWKSGI